MAINLIKGQKIDLKKHNGADLSSICLGLNWGAIQKRNGFFGKVTIEAVDLDASCAVFDKNKKLVDVIYFDRLVSANRSIQHSGDDRVGDTDGDDGLDNEIIYVDLNNLPEDVEQIVFMLNSYTGHDFSIIPFASIQVYIGSFKKIDEVLAKFDVAKDIRFANYKSLIMGKVYKKNNKWKFSAIGETSKDVELVDTITTIMKYYI
jgi:tellurium resistance protein TerZ